MEQKTKPVESYYYSESEWNRLGCGELPEKRRRESFLKQCAQGNPVTDGKAVKGSN